MKRHFRTVVFGVALSAALGGALLSGQSGPAASSDPFKNLHFRSIGPAQASGRVSALATYEANPAVFYVGSAHGGVWKTTNNGASFTAQFQNEGLISIGALAVSQKNADLVWAGTGESNNRQSTGWGDGIFKSTDGGKTFKNMGLKTSEHIGRIVIDAENDNVVLVAATGPSCTRRLPFSILRPTAFFENFDDPKNWNPLKKGTIKFLSTKRIKYCATYDIGRAAALMFKNRDAWLGRTLDVIGWEGDLSEVAKALEKAGGVPVKPKLAMPIFLRRLFLKDLHNMFLYFEAGGPKGSAADFKKIIPDALSAEDWFRFLGHYSNGEKIGS